MNAKVKAWDCSKPAFIWSWSRSHYRKQENAISCHHRKMANDKMRGLFPALCTQNAQLSQYLGLQHCLSSTSSSSEQLAPHRGKFSMNPQTQPRLLCNWNPLGNTNQQLPLSWVQGERERKEYSIIIQIMKERSERALRQVKYLRADHYCNLFSCLAAFLFLLFGGLFGFFHQLGIKEGHWKRDCTGQKHHLISAPCSALPRCDPLHWAACATAQPHIRKGSHSCLYLRMLLWNLILHSQRIHKKTIVSM